MVTWCEHLLTKGCYALKGVYPAEELESLPGAFYIKKQLNCLFLA